MFRLSRFPPRFPPSFPANVKSAIYTLFVGPADSVTIYEAILTIAADLHSAIATVSGKPDHWHSTLLVDLAAECLANAAEVANGAKEENPMRCAWGGRNLLELQYFIRFVTASQENARHFYLDVIRDINDLLRKFGQYQATHPFTESPPYVQEMEELIDGGPFGYSYKKVSDIADELGEKAAYETMNKYFSKLVHPTSLSVQLRKMEELRKLAMPGLLQAALNIMQNSFPLLVDRIRAFEVDREC